MVLNNQKQRGNLGEAGLELILTNVLPPGAFKMQYQFGNGETVDAAIMAKERPHPDRSQVSARELPSHRRRGHLTGWCWHRCST